MQWEFKRAGAICNVGGYAVLADGARIGLVVPVATGGWRAITYDGKPAGIAASREAAADRLAMPGVEH